VEPPGGRTVMSHARTSQADKLLIKPTRRTRPAQRCRRHVIGKARRQADGQFVNESSRIAGQPGSDHQTAREVSQCCQAVIGVLRVR
jgi:hypothetical protein